MSPPREPTATLRVELENPLLLVRVVGPDLRELAPSHATSGFERPVPPGIHRVEAMAPGGELWRTYVEIAPGETGVVRVPWLPWPTTAPLGGASATDAHGTDPSRVWSEEHPDATLLVVLRDPAAPVGAFAPVAVLDRAGAGVGQLDDKADLRADGCVGRALKLPPGAYRLRVKRGGRPEEMAVHVCAGFRTVVHLVAGAAEGEGERVPALREASVVLAPAGRPIALDAPAVAATDLVLKAAVAGKPLGPLDGLAELALAALPEHPLLALALVVTALLRPEAADEGWVRTLVVGLVIHLPDLPDVALLGARAAGATVTLADPPLLAATWALFARAGGDVAPGSLADQIALRLLPGGAWLRWEGGAAPPRELAPDAILKELARATFEHYGMDNPLAVLSAWDPFEQAVARWIGVGVRDPGVLAERLGLPTATVERLLRQMWSRFQRWTEGANVTSLLLYGSQVRGDTGAGSDVDLLGLVDTGPYRSEGSGRTRLSLYPYPVFEGMVAQGSLFVWGLRVEGQMLADAGGRLRRLLDEFQLRGDYGLERTEATEVAWLLFAEGADDADGELLRRTMRWAVRTIAMTHLAERRVPAFSPAAMAEALGDADVAWLLRRYEGRPGAGARERVRAFLDRHGARPPAWAGAPLASLLTRTDVSDVAARRARQLIETG